MIRSETARYKDLVLAIDREMHSGEREIIWDLFVKLGYRYEPHSIIVGKASDELKQMGFMPMFIYDKEHLRASMFPEFDRSHSHGLSMNIMLNLPSMMNTPVAIVTEHSNKTRTTDDGEYRCLHFLFAAKEDGEQKYYRAIVQPQAHHNGLLNQGFASKIITFHEMDENRFNAIMKNVLGGERQLLYFNNQRYLDIDSISKQPEFNNYQSGSMSIQGHYTQDMNLRKVSRDHKEAVQFAVTAEMNKLILGKRTPDTAFPIFTNALKTLAIGDTLQKVQAARNTIYAACALSNDRVLRMRTQEYADKSFARSYIRLWPLSKQEDYIKRALNRIQSISINSQSDMEYACDEIERIVRNAPTLKNLKINFSDNVAETPQIVESRKLSGQFEATLEEKMAEILNIKNMEWNRLNNNQQVQNIIASDEQSNKIEEIGEDGPGNR